MAGLCHQHDVLRAHRVIPCVNFPLRAEGHPTVYAHSWLIRSPLSKHWGCLRVLGSRCRRDAALHVGEQHLFETRPSFILGVYPEVELQGHMLILFIFFLFAAPPCRFFTTAAPPHTPSAAFRFRLLPSFQQHLSPGWLVSSIVTVLMVITRRACALHLPADQRC